MTYTTLRHRCTRVTVQLLLLFAVGGSTGCSDPLEVSDPTAILENDLNNAEGAQLLRRDALRQFYVVAGQSAWDGGLLADEFLTQPSAFNEQSGIITSDDLLDRRETEQHQEEGRSIPGYDAWQALRSRATSTALAKLQAYALSGAREAYVGEMLAVRGYAALRLAEDFCPGFPLHDVVDYKVVYGVPLSTEQVFDRALASFDSAVSWTADSARVLNFARIGRARTLLNLGRFAEAASAVTEVPTIYAYQTEYNASLFITNFLAGEPGWNQWGVERSVANREGGTGLDFVAAKDPRVKTDSVGPSRNGAIGLYRVAKYPSRTTPIVLANGIEARLIEAEAALRADGNPQWLTILNTLRTNGTYTTRRNAQDTTKTDTLWNAGSGNVAGLGPLADPGSEAARVDLLFRERAFWLFGTGHRLGDLRRLTRLYGRPSQSVFPSATYWRGGSYGTGTSLPFSKNEVTYSPGVTGCTSW